MPDERYAWGTTLAAFNRSVPGIVESTLAASIDSAFTPYSILIPINVDFIRTMPFVDAVSTLDLWCHFEIYPGTSNVITSVAVFYNDVGVRVADLIVTSGNVMQLRYWNGATMVASGVPWNFSSGVRYRIDIHVTAGAAGRMDLYVASTLQQSIATLNAAVTNFASAEFYGMSLSTNTYYSQIMLANFDTRDSRYKFNALTGVSAAYTDGTGTSAEVGEAVLDESTSATLTVVGNKRGFTKAAVALPLGYRIGAACVAGRLRINGGVVTDGKLGIKSGASVSLSSGRSCNAGYEPRGHYTATDPATATNFLEAAYDASEIYFEAA